MYVTKTDIIEYKGGLVRKYLEKREIGSVDQNNDRGYMTLPFTDFLSPEFWNLNKLKSENEFINCFSDRSKS